MPASHHQKLIPTGLLSELIFLSLNVLEFMLLQDCIMHMHCFVCVCRSLTANRKNKPCLVSLYFETRVSMEWQLWFLLCPADEYSWVDGSTLYRSVSHTYPWLRIVRLGRGGGILWRRESQHVRAKCPWWPHLKHSVFGNGRYWHCACRHNGSATLGSGLFTCQNWRILDHLLV